MKVSNRNWKIFFLLTDFILVFMKLHTLVNSLCSAVYIIQLTFINDFLFNTNKN